MSRALSPQVLAVAALLIATVASAAENDFIIVQSTTSTQNSGLYDAILPKFTAETGISVRVVAVGTGQAIKNAKNCDGDVLLVHSRSAEEEFVADGFGVRRRDLMYNDFVIVGPASDPAGIAEYRDAQAGLAAIANKRALFASRGDDSGTHRTELRLWEALKIDPVLASGTWYRETGAGMGATLNIAVAMDAYTLTDRATWLSFRNKQAHTVLMEGDPDLFNQYGIIPVDPKRCARVKANLSERFVDWMLSPGGQSAIANYRVEGHQLFFVDTRPRD